VALSVPVASPHATLGTPHPTSPPPPPSPSVFASPPSCSTPTPPQPDNQNIFFSGITPENTLGTSQGDLKMDAAFPVGRFTSDQEGDAVITGTNAEGQQVKAVVRLALPVYNTEKAVLGVKAQAVPKGEAALLAGGKAEEALADPAVVTLDQDKEARLTNVKVWVDSKRAEAPDAATPATTNAGRRLTCWNCHHHYDPWYVCGVCGASKWRRRRSGVPGPDTVAGRCHGLGRLGSTSLSASLLTPTHHNQLPLPSPPLPPPYPGATPPAR